MENVWQLVTSIKTMIEKADEDEKDLKSIINKLILLDLLEQQQEEEDSDRV